MDTKKIALLEHEHLIDVISELNDRLIKVEKEIECVQEAFPNKDPSGHRLYHERMIRQFISDENMKATVKTDLVQKAIMVLLAIVAAYFGFNNF